MRSQKSRMEDKKKILHTQHTTSLIKENGRILCGRTTTSQEKTKLRHIRETFRFYDHRWVQPYQSKTNLYHYFLHNSGQFCHFVSGHILSKNRNFRTSVGVFCKYMISSTNAAIALFVVLLSSLLTALFLTAIFWISLIMVQFDK